MDKILRLGHQVIENVYGSSAHTRLRQLIDEISSKEVMLMREFNYRGIEWTLNSSDNSASVESRMFWSV